MSDRCVLKNNKLKFWKILEIIVLVLFLLMIFVVSYQVICREFFKVSVSWTEEIARWCYIWGIFLGSALAMKNRLHIKVTFLFKRYSPYWKMLTNIISDIVACAFLVSIWWGSIMMMLTTKAVFAGSFNISMAYLYLSLLIGIGIMIYLKVLNLFIRKNK